MKGIERLAEFEHETFANRLGEKFVVNDEFDLELVEATALPTRGEGQTRAPFALIFRGDQSNRIPCGTHQVQHSTLQEFPLSINIVMPSTNQQGDSQSYYYESIFA